MAPLGQKISIMSSETGELLAQVYSLTQAWNKVKTYYIGLHLQYPELNPPVESFRECKNMSALHEDQDIENCFFEHPLNHSLNHSLNDPLIHSLSLNKSFWISHCEGGESFFGFFEESE
jgi:hypothetical protein